MRIEPYRAAILLTGEARPPRVDVRHASVVLHALVDNQTTRYRVRACPDVRDTFLIEPTGA